MSAIDSPKSQAAIRSLKEEIERLTEHQSEALKMAAFVGMTTDEAEEYDERHCRIVKLVQKLEALTEAR